MRQQGKPYHYTVTATTRPRRSAETEGADYFFVTEEEFRKMVRDGELLEWAEVYGHLYGVPKSQVVSALGEGWDVIIEADVQGAATLRRLAPDAVSIFLAPPSREELARRLGKRMTESSNALEVRLRTAEAEMVEAGNFEHLVTNHRDRLDDTVNEIEAIVARERTRVPPRNIAL